MGLPGGHTDLCPLGRGQRHRHAFVPMGADTGSAHILHAVCAQMHRYMSTDSQVCMWPYAFETESVVHLPLGMWLSVHANIAPYALYTHAWKNKEGSLSSSSPGRISSQLMAFSDTVLHLLLGPSSAFVKLSDPRNRAGACGLGFPRCLHMACHLHTQPFLSPGALCSQQGRCEGSRSLHLSFHFSNIDLYKGHTLASKEQSF